MKKLLSLLCLALALSLCACSSEKEEVVEDDSMDDVFTVLSGYWTRTDGYVGESYIYEFYLDEEGTWTAYFADGSEAGGSGVVTVSDGSFIMDGIFEDGEQVCYTIASNDELLDDDGDVIYRRTDEMVTQSFDRVDLDVTGTWYLISNTASYITFNADGTCEMYDADYDETSTSTYTVGEYECGSPNLNGVDVGEEYSCVQVEFEDIFFSNYLTLVADNYAMISANGDEVYISQLAMEDPNVNQQAHLVAREFINEDNSNEHYYFFLNHSVAYISDTEANAIDHIGTWELDEYGDLTITWETGEVKTGEVITNITYDILTFDDEAATFNNKSIWDY